MQIQLLNYALNLNMRSLIHVALLSILLSGCFWTGETMEMNLGSEEMRLEVEAELKRQGVWSEKKDKVILVVKERDLKLAMDVANTVHASKYPPGSTFVALSDRQLKCMREVLDRHGVSYTESVVDGKIWVTARSKLPEVYPFTDCTL